jgi:hypothetical protein
MDKEAKQDDWFNYPKNWIGIPKEVVELMLKQSESALTGRMNSIETTTNRADKLMAIYIPICTALAVYVLPNMPHIFSKYLLTCGFLCLVVAFAGIVFCILNVKKYVVNELGTIPMEIVRTEYTDIDLTDEEKYINISLAVCTNTQTKIDNNDTIFSIRSRYNQWALYLLFMIPCSPLIVYLLALWIGYPKCYF